MAQKDKLRGWPVLVISSGGVIHISRSNAPHFDVNCDCGRAIGHRGHLSSTPADIRKVEGRSILLYDRFEYKFCTRCGSLEDFAVAQEEYLVAIAANKKAADAKRESDAKKLSMTQAAVRACMAAEILYGQSVDDVEHDGWALLFTKNGIRYKLQPEEPPCPSE